MIEKKKIMFFDGIRGIKDVLNKFSGDDGSPESSQRLWDSIVTALIIATMYVYPCDGEPNAKRPRLSKSPTTFLLNDDVLEMIIINLRWIFDGRSERAIQDYYTKVVFECKSLNPHITWDTTDSHQKYCENFGTPRTPAALPLPYSETDSESNQDDQVSDWYDDSASSSSSFQNNDTTDSPALFTPVSGEYDLISELGIAAFNGDEMAIYSLSGGNNLWEFSQGVMYDLACWATYGSKAELLKFWIEECSLKNPNQYRFLGKSYFTDLSYIAAENGHLECLEVLHSNHWSTSIFNPHKLANPFHIAIENRHSECWRYLLLVNDLSITQSFQFTGYSIGWEEFCLTDDDVTDEVSNAINERRKQLVTT